MKIRVQIWKVLKWDERQSTGFVCTDITNVFICKQGDHIIKTAQSWTHTTSPSTFLCPSHGFVCAVCPVTPQVEKELDLQPPNKAIRTSAVPQRPCYVRTGQCQGCRCTPQVLYTHSTHRPPNHAPSSQEKPTHCASVGGVHSLEKRKKQNFNCISGVLGKLSTGWEDLEWRDNKHMGMVKWKKQSV